MTSPEALWQWFSAEHSRLYALDAEEVAGRFAERLQSLDERLGVEVGRQPDGPFEVIITAQGNRDVFSLVRALVEAAPAVAGWEFIALKPAMGFDFRHEWEDGELDASQLRFEPLTSPSAPGALGLRVYVSDALAGVEGVESALWRMIETGVGEEAASRIVHLEAAPDTDAGKEVDLRLPELPAYIDWHRERHG